MTRRIIEMPPPPLVRQRIDELRRLEPPADLLRDVLREVDAVAQVPPPRTFLRFALTVGAATALAAAVLAVALIVIRQANVGGPDLSPAPTASPMPPASVTPTGAGDPTPIPISELPSAGTVEAMIPIEGFQILTLGAFDQVWLANQELGTVTRVDPETNELAATYQVRPEGQGGRLWLAATEETGTLWVGTGGEPSLIGIDPLTGDVVAELALGADPFTMAARDGEVWFTDFERGLVIGVDAATAREIHRVEVRGPTGIDVGGVSVWVASPDSNQVVEIDRASGEVLRSIATGPTPFQVFEHPDGGDIFLVGRDGFSVAAIDTATGEMRRGTKELTALALVGDTLWGLLPQGLAIGPLDRAGLEFTALLELPTPFGEDLVHAAGSVWTIDGDTLYRVRPRER